MTLFMAPIYRPSVIANKKQGWGGGGCLKYLWLLTGVMLTGCATCIVGCVVVFCRQCLMLG